MTSKELPDLKLRGLRTFVAVAETGSILEAAKRMRGSSSGISQQISSLETALETKLFDHSTRPMRLTSSGLLLRSHAYKILEAVANAHAELSIHNLSNLRNLTIAVIDDLDTFFTPALVSRLLEWFQGCFVSAYSGRSDQLVESLENREADICISATTPDNVEVFSSIPILTEPFILVAAKGLLDQKQDIIAQLKDAPFIQYSESIPIGRIVTQHLKRVRFNYPRYIALEASRSVIATVVQSRGWSLTTPLNLLDAERFANQIEVVEMPFPAFSRNVFLISRHVELGDLPDRLAEECRSLVTSQVIPRFSGLVPHMSNAIKIIPG
ncbi:hypothetical protein A9Q96_11615 [Rhodobacterales bacterium 52_120_T64]|nr:hypothetical protein A9Q96_11615 [Rhodobacterales bacterium 52_120_T64]